MSIKKPLLTLLIFCAVGLAAGLFITLGMGEEETQSVPFKTTIEMGLAAENSAYALDSADEDDFKSKVKSSDNNALYIGDAESFLRVVPLSDEQTVHKTFTLKNRPGRREEPAVPRHVYWISAFSGTAVFAHEEIYTPPPTNLAHGGSGFFEKIESDTIVFTYSELGLYATIGIGVMFSMAALGFAVATFWIIRIGRIAKKNRSRQSDSPSA
jgi:hypothetical protein